MKNPLVSIIVPTYQRPNLLKRCLKSLTNQTYPNLEIIVVNNFPQQPLKKIISDVKSKQIKLYQETKQNSAHARNTGLLHATGDYICFCDDDDQYLPHKVQTQLDFMQVNPRLAFSYHNFYFKKNNQLTLGITKPAPTNFPDLLTANFFTIHSGSLMIKTKQLKKPLSYHTNLSSEDADFNYRLASKYQFDYLNQPLSIYNLHLDNKKTRPLQKHFQDQALVKIKYLKKAIKQSPAPLLRRELLYHQARLHLYQNHPTKARYKFFQFIKTKPVTFWPYLFILFSFMPPDFFSKHIIPHLPLLQFNYHQLKQKLPF